MAVNRRLSEGPIVLVEPCPEGGWQVFPRREAEQQQPANVTAEAALLGACLFDNTILDLAAARLRPESFFEPAHEFIFEMATAVRANGSSVSPVTLKPAVENSAVLRELGGASYLARLTSDGQGMLAPVELIDQIAELAARRELLNWLRAAQSAAADLSQPLTEITPPSNLGASPLVPLDLAALAQRDPVPKAFIIPKLAPAGEVSLFSGAGAIGKSLLAQQLCTAIAAGRKTLGLNLEQAPAIYLTCEDDPEQLHWRQAAICRALHINMADLAGDLHLHSLRGEPDNALAYWTPDGRLIPSLLYGRLSTLIANTGAKLVALDNVAHLYTGNENDRGQVTQFINLLNRLAGKTGAAILLLAHPNKAGDSYSGSTAWLNAVRSQASMGRPEGDHEDPDTRVVTVGKPNYCQSGESIKFRWHEWAFVLDEEIPADQRAELDSAIKASAENAAFLRCLEVCTEQRRAVSHNPGVNYAPAVFAKMPEGKGYNRTAFESAFERLLSLGQIAIDQQLWKRENRSWKFGIKACAPRTDPLAPTPCTDPHRPKTENGGITCIDPHAPTPHIPTVYTGGAEGGPPPSVSDEGGAHD